MFACSWHIIVGFFCNAALQSSIKRLPTVISSFLLLLFPFVWRVCTHVCMRLGKLRVKWRIEPWLTFHKRRRTYHKVTTPFWKLLKYRTKNLMSILPWSVCLMRKKCHCISTNDLNAPFEYYWGEYLLFILVSAEAKHCLRVCILWLEGYLCLCYVR